MPGSNTEPSVLSDAAANVKQTLKSRSPPLKPTLPKDGASEADKAAAALKAFAVDDRHFNMVRCVL